MAQIFKTDDHDTILRKFADQVVKNNPDKYQVTVNLPDEDQVEVGGVRPDIVLVNPEDSSLEIAIEIETASTLTETQASDKWRPISASVPKFIVVLPKGMVNRAKRYCKRFGIKASFHEI